MKKIGLLVLLSLLLSLCLAGCGGQITPPELRIEQVYTMAQDAGYTGTLDELIAAFKGDSAYQIAVSKGYTGSEADWLAGLVGASGKDGKDGITPHIGENGNWYIGSADSGVKARGEDGTNGKSAYQIWLDNGHTGTEADFLEWLKGQDGNNGSDGKSAYEIFKQYNPDYIGSEEQWISDLVSGRLIRQTITFKAAGSPDIVKSVFYGYTLTDIPVVPEKAGNTGEWDRTAFDNITEDITVTAVYRTKGLIFEPIDGGAACKLVSANLENNTTLLIIPSKHEGKPVTVIGYEAFANQTTLTDVTIPNSVTMIEQRAFFGCNKISRMSIPFVGESLNGTNNTYFKYIFGASSYDDYYNTVPSSLKTVVITGATSIGYRAFINCYNLTSVTIESGVSTIGEDAFRDCFGLTSVTIESGVTSIGVAAFSGCSGLTTITIPDSVTSIGTAAFTDCTNLKYEIYDGTLKYIGNVLFGATTTSVSNVSLKPTTTVIYSDAFSNCSGLTSIIIPDSVSSIGDSAFSGCSGLTSIIIPDNVTSLGNSAFYGCSSLTSVTIGNNVASIGNSAFYNCSDLTSITIPNSVISIGNNTFYNCTGLTSVTIGNNVASIGNSAFYNCDGLTSVTLGNNVTSIGDDVFTFCFSLTSITIPNSVTSIGNRAFSYCSSLTSITIPAGVTSLGNNAFRSCSGLTSITIPDSVTSIGDSAFSHCSGLTSIIIPDGVTSIGDSAFSRCSSLTSVTIGNSVTSIGSSAFSGCKLLNKVYYGGADSGTWDQITIADANKPLTDAARYYYSEVPIYDGAHWRYVDNVATVWMNE